MNKMNTGPHCEISHRLLLSKVPTPNVNILKTARISPIDFSNDYCQNDDVLAIKDSSDAQLNSITEDNSQKSAALRNLDSIVSYLDDFIPDGSPDMDAEERFVEEKKSDTSRLSAIDELTENSSETTVTDKSEKTMQDCPSNNLSDRLESQIKENSKPSPPTIFFNNSPAAINLNLKKAIFYQLPVIKNHSQKAQKCSKYFDNEFCSDDDACSTSSDDSSEIQLRYGIQSNLWPNEKEPTLENSNKVTNGKKSTDKFSSQFDSMNGLLAKFTKFACIKSEMNVAEIAADLEITVSEVAAQFPKLPIKTGIKTNMENFLLWSPVEKVEEIFDMPEKFYVDLVQHFDHLKAEIKKLQLLVLADIRMSQTPSGADFWGQVTQAYASMSLAFKRVEKLMIMITKRLVGDVQFDAELALTDFQVKMLRMTNIGSKITEKGGLENIGI